MTLSLAVLPRVARRAAPPRWMAPVGLALIALLTVPGISSAQISGLPGVPGLPSLPPLAGSGCSAPSAATAPFLQVFVNGVCQDLSGSLTPGVPGIWNLSTTTLTFVGGTVNVSAQFRSDPFITFQAATNNAIAGPVTYAFLFGTPVVPGLYTSASSSGAASVTAGAGGNASVTPSGVYPAYISGYGTQGASATNLGVDLGTTTCTATGTATTSCNFGTNNSTFAPTFYDNLEALLTYSQSDSLSAAAFTGRVDLNGPATNTGPGGSTVPEPASLSLLATGLVGLGGALRMRKRGKRA